MAERPAIAAFNEMLLEPVVSTSRFHEVMSGVYDDGSNWRIIEYLEELLHVPDSIYTLEQWQQYALQLAREGKIATMQEIELLKFLEPEEKKGTWQELSKRLVAAREAGSYFFRCWRDIDIDKEI